MSICYEENPSISDTDIPEFFEKWIEDQNIDSLLIHAEAWGRYIKNTILKEVTNLTK